VYRRSYLAGAGLALAGCAGARPGQTAPEPTVRSNEPTVAAGGSVTVTALAEGVDRLGFDGVDDEHLSPEAFAVDPPADAAWESRPPVWTWDRPVSGVRAEMTVAAGADAPGGTYPYAVSAAQDEESVRRTFTLRVRR